jgi:glycosyltransferase involved in cell wall biosynthesis
MNTEAVLIPMLDEASVIGDVISDLRSAFDLVVCVDDGSSDQSIEVARGAGAVILGHAVNLGQGAALRTGFEYLLSRQEIDHVITFDADGQHRSADAVAMLAKARETGVDVVLGTRAGGGTVGQPALARLTLRAGLWYSRRTSGLDLTDTHNGLRVLNRRALSVMRLAQRGMAHASEIEMLIAKHRLTYAEHPVSITYSEYSRSKGQGSLNAFNIVYDLLAARLNSPA